MKTLLRPLFLGALLLGSVAVCATPIGNDEKPDVGPNSMAQSAADALRIYASADGAFIHAGFLKETFSKDDLSTWLKYPTDEIMVLSLTGEQIRSAFELSVSLYPESNMSFLQISGFEVTFKKGLPSMHRVTSVSANGTPLENGKSYSIAMPSLLAHGAVGYFRIWGKGKTTKSFPKITMEDVLKGKKATEGSLRWSVQG